MTYSLSREKTTIRVYIMNYTEAMNEGLVEIPIKDVISRYASRKCVYVHVSIYISWVYKQNIMHPLKYIIYLFSVFYYFICSLIFSPMISMLDILQGHLIRTDQPSEVTSVELDDLCTLPQFWILPQYRVIPSILDGRVKDVNFYSGMLQATVTLKRVEL
ncbi:unnamed protein product [Musa acuminata subsp. malaccensis]|uniref:(wild Malaysian banana) hypothetical protein n=1 Tax=Musa acuminata subsp. malaccensis TaxID=214687 RepID=A0A804J9C8_MUSAM|nr:unnamed protein product [Musa acuminata subsp. malaccensis]